MVRVNKGHDCGFVGFLVSGTSRWWCNNVEVGSLLAYVCQRIICILLTAQEIPCQNK